MKKNAKSGKSNRNKRFRISFVRYRGGLAFIVSIKFILISFDTKEIEMKNDSCPKCNSTEIIPNAEISYSAAGGSPRSVTVGINSAREANKLFSKISKTSEMRAWVCDRCGFTEIYTLGIKEISADYR